MKDLQYMPCGTGKPGRITRSQREFEMEMADFHSEIFSTLKIAFCYLAGIVTGALALLVWLW